MERREKSHEIPTHRSRQRERFNDTDNFLKAKVLKFTQDVENLSHVIIKKEIKKCQLSKNTGSKVMESLKVVHFNVPGAGQRTLCWELEACVYAPLENSNIVTVKTF